MNPEVECIEHSGGQIDHISRMELQGDFLQDDGKDGKPIGKIYRGEGSLNGVGVQFGCTIFDDGEVLLLVDPVNGPQSTDDVSDVTIDQEAPADVSEDEVFYGEPSVETITVNQMQLEIPKGIRIPESSLVTHAESTVIFIADEDPTVITAMVESSAAESGYEVFAETDGGKVFVGQGNAVLYTSAPNTQMITWGPEVMKDALAQS